MMWLEMEHPLTVAVCAATALGLEPHSAHACGRLRSEVAVRWRGEGDLARALQWLQRDPGALSVTTEWFRYGRDGRAVALGGLP
jgi:hypothetical protein